MKTLKYATLGNIQYLLRWFNIPGISEAKSSLNMRKNTTIKKLFKELNTRYERLKVINSNQIKYNLARNVRRFLGDRLKIVKDTTTYNERFNITESMYHFEGRLVKGNKILTLLLGLIQEPNTYFKFTFNHLDKFISTKRYKGSDNLWDEHLMKCIDLINYYKVNLGELVVTVTETTGIPAGGSSVNLEPFLQGRRGFIRINNDDNKCGQRCLALARCDLKYRRKIVRGVKSIDNKLQQICDLLDNDKMMEFTDFDKYDDARVVIISKSFEDLYDTNNGQETIIYIYYDFVNKHYHLIDKIKAFINDNADRNVFNWCDKCMKKIKQDNFHTHKCIDIHCGCCRMPFGSLPLRDEHFKNPKWVSCDQCNYPCPSLECLKHHKETFKVCDPNKWKCNGKCRKMIDKSRREEHLCDEVKCKNCEGYFVGEHRCYIKTLEVKNPIYNKFFAYDFECDVENEHTVNFVVVKQLWGDCSKTFNTIAEFADWSLQQKQSVFIAHNGKAYDAWILLQYFIRKTGHRPDKLISSGNKVMSMKFKGNVFIDSINHIAQRLEDLPKMFGLNGEKFKKGHFPYKFNIKTNKDYVGKIPDVSFYEPNRMSIGKRKEFFAWYETQKDVEYDFRKELEAYCISDVDILKQSLEVYSDNAIQFNGGNKYCNPLLCPTIASYCLKMFRLNHLKHNIAVLNKEEYTFCKRGFFGGRTEVIQLYKKWTQEEIEDGKYGRYVDIQSLYPSVQFYDYLPEEAPRWDSNITGNLNQYVENNFGVLEVDIQCPGDLYIPLLPEKKNGKLVFDLEPKTNAVYTSIELEKAIQKGYVITKIHKALIFKKSNSIFKSYVRGLLKGKVEASGTNLEGKELEEFIREHKKRFDIDLDVSKMKLNSGMRALMKIQLNSLWGKFGQKCDMTKTEYVTDPKKWFALFKREQNGKIETKFEKIIDESTLFVEYCELEEENTSLPTTSVAIACFTTSNARLRLYKELEKLDKRVIYMDTDSIIYEFNKELYNVPEGNYLGEWESETDDKPIHEFVAIAPKSYGYKYCDKIEVKFKGFTLNYENSAVINFNAIKNLVDGKEKELTTTNLDFKKDNKKGVITTRDQVKKAVFNFNKRRVDKYNTYPFGYLSSR
jgi:hypothetical protein